MRVVQRRVTTYRTPWCDCSLGAGTRAGFAYSEELNLWVERNCRRPTRMVWQKHRANG